MGPSDGVVLDLQVILDDFYAERRRDPSTGNPIRTALEQHILERGADDLERLEPLTAKEVKD